MSLPAAVAPARAAIPKASLPETLRARLGGKRERIDMLSRLEHLYDERGPVVAQDAGVFQMVRLFGLDANRFVLLDRDRIFSSRKPWMMIMGPCIGYRFAEVQVKSILHQMLLRHRWSLPEGYRMPVQQAPISKPLDGLPIRLESA